MHYARLVVTRVFSSPVLMNSKISAILIQIGNFSTAYFTVVMALHTCASLVFRFRQTKWAGATIITVGWLGSIAIG